MKPYAATGGKPIWNEGMTPIGLICHLYHDRPRLKFRDKFMKEPDIDPETGLQKAEYRLTLAWSKQRIAELQPMIDLVNKTRNEAWPEAASGYVMQNGQQIPFNLQPFFRDGDNPEHNTEGREYLYGRYYLNLKANAKASRDKMNPQVIHYEGAPGIRGPNGEGDVIMPSDIFPGCTGRASFIVFGTEYAGKHYVSIRLQNIQLYEQCEQDKRIGGGGRPSPDKQFGSLTGNAPSNPSDAGMFGASDPFGQAAAVNPFGSPNPFSSSNAFPAQSNPFAQPAQQFNQQTGNRIV